MFTSAIDGFSYEANRISKSHMPLSFENNSVPEAQGSETFVNVLNGVIDDYNHRVQLTMDMLSGKDVDVHALMIAQAQVDMVSNLGSTVATKVATAYQTLMNMQV